MTDITIVAGDDYILTLVYKDNAGVIIDITSGSARMMVRKSYYSTPVITKVATIDGPLGEMVFDFDPADTNSLVTLLSKQIYIYDVELTEANGDITTVLTGDFIVQQAVTRD
jgi:hypothetical protein